MANCWAKPVPAHELWRAFVVLLVTLGVIELGFRLGINWLGPAILLGAVAVVELYQRLQRHRKAS